MSGLLKRCVPKTEAPPDLESAVCGLVGWFGGVGIFVILRGVETQMALEALLAAIRIDAEEVVEQELDRAMSSCPADRHASTVWTTRRSS